MKLATYHDGSRDGQLVVVSRDLATAHYATGIATRLQQVLDDWNFLAPQLEALSLQLQQGRARHAFAFEPQRCMAPLPRAHAWFDFGLTSTASRTQGQAVSAAASSDDADEAAEGDEPPAADAPEAVAPDTPVLRGRARTAWRLAQIQSSRPGDATCPPQGYIDPGQAGSALRLTQGLAAITGDVARGVLGRDAIEAVRLLMWVQDWTGSDDARLSLGVACSPVVLTPDELGLAWQSGVLRGLPRCALDGRWLGAPAKAGRRAQPKAEEAPASADLPRWPQGAHVGDLIASAARARGLQSGSVVAWYAGAEAAAEALSLPTTVGWGHSLRVETPAGADSQPMFGSLQHTVGRPPEAAPDKPAEAAATAATDVMPLNED